LRSVKGSKIVSEIDSPINPLIAGISGSAALIGHDSGPSHIASALGVPTLAFYPLKNMQATPLDGPSFKRMCDMTTISTPTELIQEVKSFLSAMTQ